MLGHVGSAHSIVSDGIFLFHRKSFVMFVSALGPHVGKAEIVKAVSLKDSKSELLRVFLTDVSLSSGEKAFVLPKRVRHHQFIVIIKSTLTSRKCSTVHAMATR